MLYHIVQYKWGENGGKMQQITARQIASLKKSGRYRVTDNLSVQAKLKNNKIYATFVLRYQLDGKVIDKSLGSTAKLTLLQAKEKAEELMAGMTNNQMEAAVYGVPRESGIRTVSCMYDVT